MAGKKTLFGPLETLSQAFMPISEISEDVRALELLNVLPGFNMIP